MYNQKLDWSVGERNSEGADFVLLGVMSLLTLDAFALQTGSTS